MQHRKLILVSVVLTSIMALGTVAALATVFSTNPTLTLTATASKYQRRILANGKYDYAQTGPNVHACGARRGHPVTLYKNPSTVLAATTTNDGGFYRMTTPTLPAGTYRVHTFVPGRIVSHYNNTWICNDARSPDRTVHLNPAH
jgi:hypothetical protein